MQEFFHFTGKTHHLVAVLLHLLVVLVQSGQDARARVVFGVHPLRHPLVGDEVGHVGAVKLLEGVPVEVGLLGQRGTEGELFGGRGHHLVRDLRKVWLI